MKTTLNIVTGVSIVLKIKNRCFNKLFAVWELNTETDEGKIFLYNIIWADPAIVLGISQCAFGGRGWLKVGEKQPQKT